MIVAKLKIKKLAKGGGIMLIKIFEHVDSKVLEKRVNEFLLSEDPIVISLQYQPISLAPDETAGWNTEYLFTVMIQYRETR